MKIKGKVIFKNLGTGAWGVEDENGTEWRPVHMPEQLKIEHARVQLKIIPTKEAFSIHMWGKPMRIISFHTLNQY